MGEAERKDERMKTKGRLVLGWEGLSVRKLPILFCSLIQASCYVLRSPEQQSAVLFYLCPVLFHSVSNTQREPALPFRSRPLLPLLSMEDIFSSSVIRTPLVHLARHISSGRRKFDKNAILASAGNLVGGLVIYPCVLQVAI